MPGSAYRSIVLIAILLTSCGKARPTLDNFDAASWKNDKNGCAGRRGEILASLESQKSKLLALNELDIVALLGKPDQNELYKRNQKFYYYFITPAPACDSAAHGTEERLVIRFNAMGLANEILVEQ
jgi:hypothetical protein